MPQAISTYRTRIAQLLDDTTNARYTSNQIDEALRMALEEFTLRNPLVRTYTIDADGNRRLALPFTALQILNVEEWNADPSEDYKLSYSASFDDETWIIEFDEDNTPASGTVLSVKYTTTHTIDGLDSAAGTTIPSHLEESVMFGAAGFAAQTRAASRAESINLQPSVLSQLLNLAEAYLNRFRYGTASPAKHAAKITKYVEPTGY